MNAPQPIKGFGKLGNFCRSILAYAKSIDLQSIIIERIPTGSTAPPSAEIKNTPTGKLVTLKIGSGTGAGGGAQPFQLVKIDDTHIRVMLSTLAGDLPDGFSVGDDPTYVLTVSGDGYVYAEVTIDTDTGDVLSRDLAADTSVPASDPVTGYFTTQLGNFVTSGGVLAVANAGYGPAYLAREWFTYPANYLIVLS